ncbi:MAG: chalcone isomerase family protein [Acidobacteriota bacterium]
MRSLSILLVPSMLAALLALPAAPAGAAELAGVQMADSTKIGDQTLVLNGLGLRKKAIFKVYVAGLYLPRKTSNPDQVFASGEPRKLKMEFVRDVGRDSLVGAWNDCLEANNANADDTVRAGFGRLNEAMDDVSDGDRLVFTFDPAQGTEIMVRGEVKATVEGEAFADALFRCWIGPVPPSADFRTGLLGGD